MSEISILGIGVICRMGNTVDEIWSNLEKEDNIFTEHPLCLFESNMPLAKRRRANRYSEMGVYVASAAINDAKINIDKLDKDKIGTIFTTGYGPVNSSMAFAKSISEKDWESCSPTIFANSVNNTCIGHICMYLGIRGASTMFMGSNNILYTQMLFKQNKADYIITGAIEEYCSPLFDAICRKKNIPTSYLHEAATAFMTTSGIVEQAYCVIEKIEECNIGAYPVTNNLFVQDVIKKLEYMYQKISENTVIDVVLGSTGENFFDDIEEAVINKKFSKNVKYVKSVKSIFGETLGASFNVNIMVAAICLKKGYLPLRLDRNETKIRTILVSGYDLSGNYMLAILKKRDV